MCLSNSLLGDDIDTSRTREQQLGGRGVDVGILEETKDDPQVPSLGKWVDSGSELPCAGCGLMTSRDQCRRRSKFSGEESSYYDSRQHNV